MQTDNTKTGAAKVPHQQMQKGGEQVVARQPTPSPLTGRNYQVQMTNEGAELVRGKKHTSTKLMLLSMLPPDSSEPLKMALTRQFSGTQAKMHFGPALKSGSIAWNYFEKMSALDTLPDILITSGFNLFYDKSFGRKMFADYTRFECISRPLLPVFRDQGFVHPEHQLTVLAVKPLVMVVDSTQFTQLPVPREWYELLNPQLKGKVVFPGNGDGYCYAAHLPFVSNFGFQSLQQLQLNVQKYMTAGEMTETLRCDTHLHESVYVMPYAQALKACKNPNIRLVWPNDGAIAIPIQMLVKKGTFQRNAAVIDFITGGKMADAWAKAGIVPLGGNEINTLQQAPLFWPGWDFVQRCNAKKVKKEIINLGRLGKVPFA